MGIGVLFILQKMGRVHFSPKKGDVGNKVEEKFRERERERGERRESIQKEINFISKKLSTMSLSITYLH